MEEDNSPSILTPSASSRTTSSSDDPTTTEAMPKGKPPALAPATDEAQPQHMPLYWLNISNQLSDPPPSETSEEWHCLAADIKIALKRGDFTDAQSLRLIPSVDRERLEELQAIHDARRQPPRNQVNPYENLQNYAGKARLPPMPWSLGTAEDPADPEKVSEDEGKGRKNGIHTVGSSTVVSPKAVRRLRHVQRISMSQFKRRVLAYSDGHLPSSGCIDPQTEQPVLSDPDLDEGFGLIVPHHAHRVSGIPRSAPSSETEVQVNWVLNIACKTAQRILHVSEPSIKAWEYRIIRGKGTKKMLADYVWSKEPEGGRARLAIEVKTPWTLLPSDFEEFVGMQNGLPSPADLEKRGDRSEAAAGNRSKKTGRTGTKTIRSTFSTAENLMAQVYDYCIRQGHHWFIVTTYERWVFGVFSLDYRSAEVTDVLAYNCAEPTILQCIMFWTQSSMFVPGLWEIPRFLEDKTKLPDTWRDAVDHWSSHGFQELENAILHRQSKYGKGPSGQQDETFLKAQWNRINSRWRSTRDDLGKDMKGKAILGARKAWDLILSKGHIDWSIRLTWLALLHIPTRLHPELSCLQEFYVVQSWRLEDDHPLLRDTRYRKLSKVIKTQFCDPMRARPTLFQDCYEPDEPVIPEGNLKHIMGKLVSKEILIILTTYLGPDTLQEIEEALLLDGLIEESSSVRT